MATSQSSSSAIIFAIGAVISAALLSFGLTESVQNFHSFDRVVEVKGLAEREVAADTAIWPLKVVRAGDSQSTIYEQLDKDVQAIRAFLLVNGFDENELSVSSPNVLDKLAERWATEDVGFRYTGDQTLTVYTNKVEQVRELRQQLSELGKKGVSLSGNAYETQVEYHFNGLNDIKPSMIEESARNAREVALRFAEHSDSQLGKIRTADQGQFSIYDRDSNTPHIKIVRVVSTVAYQLVD
ncbi:MAG: SIMPL domain-containing protein [Gammaproteobacteria bacterium]|nr:SIMPL domain-containing protein [Gammaproteobacteria bacterium]